jgi:hypothetical protein
LLTITFVVVVVTIIGVHPMNDGLFTMLTSKVIDGLFPISIFTSNSMDQKKIINNFSHVVTSID